MSPDRDDRSGAPDPDVDAVFAQIVAGWDDDEAPPVPPWPATEDLSDARTPPADRAGTGSPRPAPEADDGPTSEGPTAGPPDQPRVAPDRPHAAPDRAAGGPPAPG